MQDLGVQATSRVLTSTDPLKTLRDVCQNFPFTARTLSKLPVNRQIAQEVHDAQNSMRSVESCLSIAGVLYSVTILYIERSTFSLAGFSDHFLTSDGPTSTATRPNSIFWFCVKLTVPAYVKAEPEACCCISGFMHIRRECLGAWGWAGRGPTQVHLSSVL